MSSTTKTTKTTKTAEKTKIKSKGTHYILYPPLLKFYSSPRNLDAFLTIMRNKSTKTAQPNQKKISLRLIDWFVTNYCKKNNVYLPKNRSINVYDSYKSNLKSFHKEKFDPFRRHNNIILAYKRTSPRTPIKFVNNTNDKNYLYEETTIGQLNFFKWIIENDLYAYIVKNRDKIEKDMIEAQKKDNEETTTTIASANKNKNKKRAELSKQKSAKPRIIKRNTIKFD